MLKFWRHMALIALLVTGMSLSGCAQNLFYQPDNILYDTPKNAGLDFEEVTFASADGTALTGWFIPAQGRAPRQAKGTVIHFHGNAQNMSAHWRFAEWLPRQGYNLFVFDYRGYGTSKGTPDLDGVLADSIAAIEHVRQRPDSTPDKLIVYGQSLGGTNAIGAVVKGSRQGIRAVIVESTFSSYSQIAHDKVPGAGWLMSDRHSADRLIDQIAPIPLLLIHGDQDKVIHHRHSERLLALAKDPKQLIVLNGEGHLTQLLRPASAQSLQTQVLNFLQSVDDSSAH